MNDKQTLIEHDGKPFIGFVVDDPLTAYNYCLDHGMCEILEPVIAKHATTSYMYATTILHDRFEAGEKSISGIKSYKEAYNKFLDNLGYDPI